MRWLKNKIFEDIYSPGLRHPEVRDELKEYIYSNMNF